MVAWVFLSFPEKYFLSSLLQFMPAGYHFRYDPEGCATKLCGEEQFLDSVKK